MRVSPGFSGQEGLGFHKEQLGSANLGLTEEEGGLVRRDAVAFKEQRLDLEAILLQISWEHVGGGPLVDGAGPEEAEDGALRVLDQHRAGVE